MPRILHEGVTYACRDGETVLEALLRQGASVPPSCRAGACDGGCLRRATAGAVPEAAQRTLRPELRERGYFLACRCVPRTDLVVETPLEADLFTPAVVVAREELAPDVVRLVLEPSTPFAYRPGQHIWVKLGGVVRAYALTSVPTEDPHLEIHVKRVPGGALSPALFALAAGDEVDVEGPHGDVAYVPGAPDEDLLLVGTGTGLAPLLGILRDALAHGHTGRIRLYHGSRTHAGLYLDAMLHEVAARHPRVRYVGCASGDGEGHGPDAIGRADQVAFRDPGDLSRTRIYLAGHPDMVERAKERAVDAGALRHRLHAEPFDERSPHGPDADKHARPTRRPRSPHGSVLLDPDPKVWAALHDGAVMREVLSDFYARVYDDERLAGALGGVPRQHVVDTVYAFLRGLFTGDKTTDQGALRDAQRWLVVDEDAFEHRSDLLEAVLREHFVAEFVIQRCRAVDELVRQSVVAGAAWPQVPTIPAASSSLRSPSHRSSLLA